MLVLKVALSALIVGGVSLLSQRYPSLGGYAAVLPIITFLSLLALVTDKHSSTEISTFLTGALAGVMLTSLTLLLMIMLLKSGVSVTIVILIGASAWGLLAFISTRFNYVLP